MSVLYNPYRGRPMKNIALHTTFAALLLACSDKDGSELDTADAPDAQNDEDMDIEETDTGEEEEDTGNSDIEDSGEPDTEDDTGGPIHADTLCEGDFEFDDAVTQGCTEIIGSLEIETDRTDLSGLENLRSVSEDLTIRFNDNLLDLNALSSLESVGNELDIVENELLVDLSGLENLQTVGRTIEIRSNGSLENIEAMHNLQSFSGFVYVRTNLSLCMSAAEAFVVHLQSIGLTSTPTVLNNADC